MNPSTFPLVEHQGYWLMGALAAFREDRLRFLAEASRTAPLVRFRLGPRCCCLVSHPDLIRDVLVTGHRHMAREPLVKRILNKTLGGGLLTSDGAHWKRQRRMIALRCTCNVSMVTRKPWSSTRWPLPRAGGMARNST